MIPRNKNLSSISDAVPMKVYFSILKFGKSSLSPTISPFHLLPSFIFLSSKFSKPPLHLITFPFTFSIFFHLPPTSPPSLPWCFHYLLIQPHIFPSLSPPPSLARPFTFSPQTSLPFHGFLFQPPHSPPFPLATYLPFLTSSTPSIAIFFF